jgi:NAD(P)H-hydrate epimerase
MHKGLAGRVGIVAGSRGMSGAAILAGLGALRGGAGLVRVYCPAAIQSIVAAAEPCLMTVPLDEVSPERYSQRLLDDPWADVLAVGPGLGAGDRAEAITKAAVVATRRPVVLDADGLLPLARAGPQAFAAGGASPSAWPAVITPHPGEMARLRQGAGLPPMAGDDDETRIRTALEYADQIGSVVVLKGFRTVVCAQDRVWINSTGNPGMATGGMGDVLTGLIAALIGQGLVPFDAARLGVHVHGLAADLCAREIGPVGYLAREVADRIPAALQQVRPARIGFH